jgi:hypothetical protein
LDTKRAPDARPALLLSGFVALLAALFAVAFVTGRLAGPVAPGMHRVAPGTAPARTAPATPGTHDMPGMDMPGMDMP